MKGFEIHKPYNLFSKKKNFAKKNAPSAFHSLWKDISAKIEAIERSFYLETLTAIAKFVQSSFDSQSLEIPTGVVHLGVNMPDHCNFFQQLNEHLKSDGNYTVILDPKKCNTVSKVLQLVKQELEMQCPLDESSLSTKGNLKHIVFVFQDVESFNLELLEEIILKLKVYVQKLPIVLIFGMSSKMVTLHRLLSQKVLSLLGIELFQPLAVAEQLTCILQEILESPSLPFKLGPKAFQLIMDNFFHHDFSITNLSHILKFCLFEHFFTSEASVLCRPRSQINKQIASLKKDELQVFKQLPSFKLYLEQNPDISPSLGNKEEFTLLLGALLEDLYACHEKFVLSFKTLSQFLKNLPDHHSKNQFCDLYAMHLNKSFHAKILNSLEKSLTFQTQKEVLSNLKSCKSHLTNQELCKDLLSLLEQSMSSISSVEENKSKNCVPKITPSESFASRFELQEKLKSSILSKQSKFRSACSKVTDELMDYYKNLRSPLLLPLHEVMFFDNASAVKNHLMPSPRLTLCSALSNPHKFYQIHIGSEGLEMKNPPDTCITYNMLLECGRFVNLHEWMENFKTASGTKTKVRKTSSRSKVDETSLVIRFLHSASELQLMGFTKLAKHKRHHVVRLVFENSNQSLQNVLKC